MKVVAVALILALLLTGCASPGPLEGGRWFLGFPPGSGPFLWIGHGLANLGLAVIYVAASAANMMQGLHGSRQTFRS